MSPLICAWGARGFGIWVEYSNSHSHHAIWADNIVFISHSHHSISLMCRGLTEAIVSRGLTWKAASLEYLNNDSPPKPLLASPDCNTVLSYALKPEANRLGSRLSVCGDTIGRLNYRLGQAEKYIWALSNKSFSWDSISSKVYGWSSVIAPIALFGAAAWRLSAYTLHLLRSWELTQVASQGNPVQT